MRVVVGEWVGGEGEERGEGEGEEGEGEGWWWWWWWCGRKIDNDVSPIGRNAKNAVKTAKNHTRRHRPMNSLSRVQSGTTS